MPFKMVDYGKMKAMKNSETVNESFELLVVICLAKFEHFGVLNSWLVMGGGRLRGVVAHSGSTVLSFFLLLTLMLWAG